MRSRRYELVTVPIALERGRSARRYRELRGRFAASYAAFQRKLPDASVARVRARLRCDTARGARRWRRGASTAALLAYPQAKRSALREILRAASRQPRAGVHRATTRPRTRSRASCWSCRSRTRSTRAERARALERFRAGECPVLVSSQVLDEGLDVPDADVAIVVGGSASARRHVQRVGRVLRPRAGKRARDLRARRVGDDRGDGRRAPARRARWHSDDGGARGAGAGARGRLQERAARLPWLSSRQRGVS